MASLLPIAQAECWRSQPVVDWRILASGSNLSWKLSGSRALQDNSNFSLEMTTMTIETKFDSNYRKVLVAARRARQLQNGSSALVASHSTKACRIAQEEIEAGKISYVKSEVEVTKPLVEGPAIPILLS